MTRLGIPRFASPFLERDLARQGPGPLSADQFRAFRKDGYLVLPDLFPSTLIDRLVEQHSTLFDPNNTFDADPDVLHKLHFTKGRAQDAWNVSDAVRDLACHGPVLELLDSLFGRPAIPFQTLNFSTGTQQPMHSDVMSFASLPRGFMCGLWVALEDVTLENGALQVAKGSHLFPDIEVASLGHWAEVEGEGATSDYANYGDYVRTQLEREDVAIETLEYPKGTAFLWASNLLHGGAKMPDQSLSRMSQVTHYYFEDCIYYTPRYSDAALGEYCLRDVRDIRTGLAVPHSLNGEELVCEDMGHKDRNVYRLRRPDTAARGEPVLTEKLEAICALQKQHLASLEAEYESQCAHSENLDQRALHIESMFNKVGGKHLYRLRTLLTGLVGRGDRHKGSSAK